MAKIARTMSGKSPLSGRAKGGKLALFEVLASSQDAEEADLDAPQDASQSAAVEPQTLPPPEPTPPVKRVSTQPPPIRFLGESSARSSQRRISAMTVAVAAASVVAVVALVYVVGRPATGPETATAEVPGGIMPEVLDVNAPGARTEAGANAALARNRQSTEQTIQKAPQIAEFAVTARRTKGLNYVLVQSYLPNEANRAEATVAALAQAGIHVTIERDIPGWPRRLCIVGVEGFERITNHPPLENYVARLEAVSDRHRNDRKIKTFEPQPIHWSN